MVHVSQRSQLSLLIWKNYQLQRRRPVGTCCELLLPVFFFGILAGLRTLLPVQDVAEETACHEALSPYDYSPTYSAGCGNEGSGGRPAEMAAWIFGEQNWEWEGPNLVVDVFYAPDTAAADEVAGFTELIINQYKSNKINFTFTGVADETTAAALASEADKGLAFILKQAGGALWTTEHTAACNAGEACNPQVTFDLRLPQDCWGQFTADGNNEEWYTDQNVRDYENPGMMTYGPYNNCRSFAYFQLSIERALATFFHPTKNEPAAAIRAKPFPFPAYLSNEFMNIIKTTAPFFLVLSLLYPVISIVRALVIEKETRIKEAMRMMGLPSWINWLAWFVKCFTFMAISMLIITVVLFQGEILLASNWFLVLIFLLLFSTSTITYCFFVSAIFSSANMAAIAAGIGFFLSFVPFFVIEGYWDRQMDDSQRHAICLLSPTCTGIGFRLIANLEVMGQGLTFDNFSDDPTDFDTFSGAKVFGMLLVDTLLYLALALYIEGVFPGEYGIPLKPWFFVLPSYWFPDRTVHVDDTGLEAKIAQSKDAHEPEPEGLKVGVEIAALRKTFGSKVAVDSISLKMFEEQITVLLGHNGAGKSTTMSMMVGLFPPSSGDVKINGHSVTTDLGGARQSLGLCPQFDVLWDTLTVREHLYFFGRLKGMSGAALTKEIDSYLKDLDLEPKGPSFSKTLSGGQKRALSVGIALIGGSKTVILDEPTSGMDPEKRRHTWDLLLKHKKGRTILLTTHFMDEADLLGDRVAIMSEGKVHCSGSSNFLKKRYGVGYHLTLVKEDGCDVDQVLGFVKNAIPSASLADDVGSEITMILPSDTSGGFSRLFTELENSQAALKIASFGVSVSTLEEVFLNVGEDDSNAHAARRRSSIKTMASNATTAPAETAAMLGTSSPAAGAQDITLMLRLRQFRAMFMKRAIHSTRHWRLIAVQILLPVLFCCAAMAMGQLPKPTDDIGCREMGLSNYEDGGQVVMSAQDLAGDYHQGYTDALKADLAEVGARAATPKQMALVASANTLVSSTALGGQSAAVIDTGSNMTARLLADAENYFKTGYMQKTVAGIVVEQSAYRIGLGESKGFCDRYNSDGSVTRVDPTNAASVAAGGITLRVGVEYQFASPTYYAPTTQTNYDKDGVPTILRSVQEVKCMAVATDPTGTCQTIYEILRNGDNPGSNNGNSNGEENNGKSTAGLLDTGTAQSHFFDTTNLAATAGPYFYYCGDMDTTDDSDPDEPGIPITLTDSGTATEPSMVVVAWYSTKAIHAKIEALNLASNIVAAEHLNGSPQFRIRNCPLPKKQADAFESTTNSLLPFLIALFMLLAFSFLSASFGMFLVTERVSLAKHVQFVSGANAFVYWIGSFAWDLCNITVSNVVITIVIAAFNDAAYTGDGRLGAIFLALELFGFAVLPFVYLLTFLFKSSSTAFALMSVAFFVQSFALLLTVMILAPLGYARSAFTVKYVGFFNPVYTISMVFYDMYQNNLFLELCVGDKAEYCATQGYSPQTNAIAMEDYKVGGIGKHLLALFLTGLIYFSLLMLVEYFSLSKLFKLCCGSGSSVDAQQSVAGDADEDDDVAAERTAVQSNANASDQLVMVNGIKKNFGSKKAVQGLSFNIGKGQCFGLLGVNGAGKTTTFKMLTGETPMSSGSVKMLGLDLASNLRAIRHHVGYCPQFGGLVGTMTGREQLTMFARLRGIAEPQVAGIVAKLMQDLNFEVHADKPSDTYSGGNKRKLSTAIALIGDPQVVFLDEPTTGMDPGTRRYLWNTLMAAVKSGRSIVLTSHSMEECEALCTRLAIMVDGRFQCIGTAQHLKNKFSEGYQINLVSGRNVPDKEANVQGLKKFTAECFPDAVLLEAHDLMLSYQVPAAYRWSELFEYVEQATKIFDLDSHTISQSSLEQIFLQMAHGKTDAVSKKRLSQVPPSTGGVAPLAI